MKKLIILSIFLTSVVFLAMPIFSQNSEEQLISQNPLIKSPIPSMSLSPLINRLQGTKWESINFGYKDEQTDPLKTQLIFETRSFKYFLTVHRFFKGKEKITIKHLKTLESLSTQSFSATPIVENELRKIILIKLLAPNVLMFDDTYYFLR